MTRAIDFGYRGRRYTAFCPAAAVFDIYEHWNVTDDIVGTTGFREFTRTGLDATCWLIAEFARWGELDRRQRGENRRPMLTLEEARLATPDEAAELRRIVGDALVAAFARDVEPDEDGEVDLTLREIDAARKKTPPRGPNGRLSSRHAPDT